MSLAKEIKPQVNAIKVKFSRDEVTHSAESYTGLYGMHKYWGKKPFNIMAAFIKKYSKENDIILDPFLGSGVSISEAVFNNRKAIGIDINPCSILITDQVISLIDTENALKVFDKIEKKAKKIINSIYSVERGKDNYIGENFLWEGENLIEVRYANGTRKRHSEPPTKEDIKQAQKIDYSDINLFYPKDSFFHNSRINAKRGNKIFNLFTPRNLFALSLIRNEIESIEDNVLKNFFLFCFTASLGQASKMVFVIKRRNKTKNENVTEEKKEIGSWVIGYWMPKEYFENNVWTCFETRFKKIIKAKKEQAKLFKKINRATSIEKLKEGNYLLFNKPSQNVLKDIPENSIDYILTDPPHGNRIPYLELSMLWNSWLKKTVNYEDEIIISEARERNKNVKEYNQLMHIVFKECFRILKPNKYLSFMFNSLDDVAWLHSVEMFYKIGFELCEIETLGYSANSVVQDNRKNGLQTDFILTFQKVTKKKTFVSLKIINIEDDKPILQKIRLFKKEGYKSFQIMNNIISDLLKKDQFVRITDLLKEINHDTEF